MSLTSRGKAVVAIAAILVVGIVALVLAGAAPDPIANAVDEIIPGDQTPPEPCPLTGRFRGAKDAPSRPVLGVKVENTDDAQPLAGLDRADIVYEEVVEGGITRFVALFHCYDAPLVGPVRSIRTTDPRILAPFSDHPLLAYSGGAPAVERIIRESGVAWMDETTASDAFTRDEERTAPHNLFVSTKALYRQGRTIAAEEPPPAPAFPFDESISVRSKRARSATIVFSSLATAEWRWSQDRWVREREGQPMVLENGSPIEADNVVIQVVRTSESDLSDVAGYPSPEVKLTGKGKAWVLRDGRVIAGRWERDEESSFTVFRTRKGEEIALRPGTTYVELAPIGMFDSEISFG